MTPNKTFDLLIPRRQSSLRQQVIERLRDAILSGLFEPGQKLVERDLCEMLGISRTVVREALQHLGAEGLIENIPHKGPVVATLGLKEARDIYAVRQALEALAGEGFAQHADAAQMQALRDALEHLKTLPSDAGQDAVLQAKNRFYGILLEGCGNQVVGNMLTLLNNRVTLLRRMSLAAPGRLGNTLVELEEIVSALEQRNGPRARQLCADHVARASAVALQGLEASAGNVQRQKVPTGASQE